MQQSRKSFLKGVLAGLVGAVLLLFLGAIAVAYTGAYDIAASRGHTAGVRWLLDTTMHQSIRRRAPEGDAAQPLADADSEAGAAEYKAMCEYCHGGATGVEPAAWSRGMLPQPPHLREAAREWDPAEVVWIVQHGVKYTGMPAFGEDHDAQVLWNIAAFVKNLPAMTAADYRRAGSSAAGHAHDQHQH